MYEFSRRYEKGHWDAVITGYKEVELSDVSFPGGSDDEIPAIFRRIQRFLATRQLQPRFYSHNEHIQWLPCHAIDLKKDGELKAHVDSIRFSGELVAGLSLLSPSIMRLVPDDGSNDDNSNNSEDPGYVDLYLPPQSLYALTGVGRYRYSHQLLPDSSIFVSPTDGARTVVIRDQRLSVIFRDAKRQKDDHDNAVCCVE
jgi:alkylated DNA repair protein alkB family protein 7